MANAPSSDDDVDDIDGAQSETARAIYLAVQKWVNCPSHIRIDQEDVLELYTLAPLLFGDHLPMWQPPPAKAILKVMGMCKGFTSEQLKYCVTRALQPGTKPAGYLSDQDILTCNNWRATCKTTFGLLNAMAPEHLATRISLWQPTSPDMKQEFYDAFLKQILAVIEDDPEALCPAILLFHHFAVYIQRIAHTADFEHYFAENTRFKEYCSEAEKEVHAIHEKGNLAFKKNEYHEAVKCYTEALKHCPFSCKLYGNRAQANLRLKSPRYALSDGLKCNVLEPRNVKAMWRYAQALFDTGIAQQAFRVNQEAQKLCTNEEDISSLQEQFEKFKTSKPADLPELVSSREGSDESGSEQRPPRLKAVEQGSKVTKATKKAARVAAVPQPTPARSITTMGNNTSAAVVGSAKAQPQPPLLPRAVSEAGSWADKLQSALRAGGDALLSEHYKVARSQYEDCLQLLSNLQPNFAIVESVSRQLVSAHVLRYSCGIACIRSNTLQDVNTGIGYFKTIIDSPDGQQFPLAYYGLGQASVLLGRYRAAQEQFIIGMHILSSMKPAPLQLMWPGTTIVIEESYEIKETFKVALLKSRYPPKPDARCVFDECLPGNLQREIYSFTCCFEGYVTVLCSHRCRLHYHNKCWYREMSRRWEKASKKDVLGKPCMTPLCDGVLSEITTQVQRDGNKKSNTVSMPIDRKSDARPKGLRQKLPAQTERSIKRKEDLKLLRKEKRLARRHSAAASISPENRNENDGHEKLAGRQDEANKELNKNDVEEYIRKSTEQPVAVLKKDRTNDVEETHPKTKTLKKKTKQKAVHLDEFIGRHPGDDETDTLSTDSYGHSWLWYDGGPSTFTAYRQHETYDTRTVSSSAGSDHGSSYRPLVTSDIRPTVVKFFEDLLRERGMMDVEDINITRYLVDSFPPAAFQAVSDSGGIGPFLTQYPQFVLCDSSRYIKLCSSTIIGPSSAAAEPTMITPRLLPAPEPMPIEPLINDWLRAPHWPYAERDRLSQHTGVRSSYNGSITSSTSHADASSLLVAAPGCNFSLGGNTSTSGYYANVGSADGSGISYSGAAASRVFGIGAPPKNLMSTQSLVTEPLAGVGDWPKGSHQGRALAEAGKDQGYRDAFNNVNVHHITIGTTAATLDDFDDTLDQRGTVGVGAAADAMAVTTHDVIVSSLSSEMGRMPSAEEAGVADDSLAAEVVCSSEDSDYCEDETLLADVDSQAYFDYPLSLSKAGVLSPKTQDVEQHLLQEALILDSVTVEELQTKEAVESTHSSLCKEQLQGCDTLRAAPANPSEAGKTAYSEPNSAAQSRAADGEVDASPADTAEGSAAVSSCLQSRSALLCDAAVQVDGLREECRLLAESLQTVSGELVMVKAEQARMEHEASSTRVQLITLLQVREGQAAVLAQELDSAKASIDAAAAALGEEGAAFDLGGGILRLKAQLATAEAERQALETAHFEQAAQLKRLQEELHRSRLNQREPQDETDALEHLCMRARKAEAAVLEQKYERAVAPLCSLLMHCKHSLSRGGLSPGMSNTIATYVERLCLSILEVKKRYEEQLALVSRGRLLSRLPDIPNLMPMGSSTDQQVLAAIAPVQAILEQPQIPKLRMPASLEGEDAHVLAAAAESSAPTPLGTEAGEQLRTVALRSIQDHALDLLVGTYPDYSRSDHARYVQRLRSECRLTGLTLRDVVEKVGELIRRDEKAQEHRQGSGDAAASVKQPTGISALPAHSRWPISPLPAAVVKAASVEVYQEETDPCIICQEQMESKGTTRLNCRHTFHSKCLKNWFDVQKTCPLCRTYDLTPDEFPSLSH